ncbi:fluoride efflux transporter CrcB, partial [Oenococcus oeni]
IYYEETFFFWRNKMNYFLMIILGVLGAESRFAIELTIDNSAYPYGTLIINMIGCFLLGFMYYFFVEAKKTINQLVAVVSTGFVGSFTTFSTFELEIFKMFQLDQYLKAISYFFVTMLSGLLFVFLGYCLSKLIIIKRKENK